MLVLELWQSRISWLGVQRESAHLMVARSKERGKIQGPNAPCKGPPQLTCCFQLGSASSISIPPISTTAWGPGLPHLILGGRFKIHTIAVPLETSCMTISISDSVSREPKHRRQAFSYLHYREPRTESCAHMWTRKLGWWW